MLANNQPPASTSPVDVFTTVDTTVEFEMSAVDAESDLIILGMVDLPDSGVLQYFDAPDWLPISVFTQIFDNEGDGRFLLRYTPNPGYSNTGGPPDEFIYRFRDLSDQADPLSVFFHVSP